MSDLLVRAKALDKADKLQKYAGEFAIPQGCIYLDGNSLGPLTVKASEQASNVVEKQWGQSLIKSWNEHDWIRLPESVSQKLSPLLGCAPHQLTCCDSISVNLFKVLAGAIKLQPERNIIVTTSNNFPTDIYIVQGLQALLGKTSCQFEIINPDEVEHFIEQHAQNIALVMLTHVDFRTGLFFDIPDITDKVHKAGALVLWDLAHSAGVVPVNLDNAKVDFAVGCTYKYLNGGPGAPAFIYVNQKWHDRISQPISGWMGHAKPFDFTLDYQPAPGIQRFLSGTHPVISMSILNASLEVFDNIAPEHLWQKSLALGEFFHECLVAMGGTELIRLGTNLEAINRNGQLAYHHPHAYEICQALIARNVIGDYRAPDVLRLGFSPLFLSFAQMHKAASQLVEVLESCEYLLEKYQVRAAVT